MAYRIICDRTMSLRKKGWLVVGSIAVAMCFWGLLDSYYGMYTTEGNKAETLTGRLAIWAWALDAGLSHPWMGNGFDAMWKVAPPFGGELFESRHAENEILQQFFAYGVCGIVLWAGVYGSLYRRFRLLPQNSERCILTSFLVFAIVRGLAEAEPFDLVLPIWLISTIALLTDCELQSTMRPAAILVHECSSLPLSAVEGDI
jgi:O-antigen ligase